MLIDVENERRHCLFCRESQLRERFVTCKLYFWTLILAIQRIRRLYMDLGLSVLVNSHARTFEFPIGATPFHFNGQVKLSFNPMLCIE